MKKLCDILKKFFTDKTTWQIIFIISFSMAIYWALVELHLLDKNPQPQEISNVVDESEDMLPDDVVDILGKDLNCNFRQLESPLNKFFPEKNACDQSTYQNYETVLVMENSNTPETINTETILRNSKKIKVSGNLENVYMYIRATVLDKEWSLLRKNSIYFYLDSGTQGGHLGAIRKTRQSSELQDYEGDNIEGVFLSRDVPVEFVLDLTKEIQVSANIGSTGSRPVNFFDKLKSVGTHYLYAYVSKRKYGRIEELSFLYSCKEAGGKCHISIEN